jgi:hypothetical protein
MSLLRDLRKCTDLPPADRTAVDAVHAAITSGEISVAVEALAPLVGKISQGTWLICQNALRLRFPRVVSRPREWVKPKWKPEMPRPKFPIVKRAPVAKKVEEVCDDGPV